MVTFPDSPPNGTEIIDRQDDGSVIIWTYNEDLNEWTYQQYGGGEPVRIFTDEVLVRENHSELPGEALADPSELLTQKDVNRFLDEKANTGGGDDSGGDIAMKPWIKIERFRREFSGGRPNGAADIYCTYDVNSLATYFWRWEMDLQADGTWVDIDDMSAEDQADIIGIQMEGYLRMGSQTSDKYPNAKIRYRITAELADVESELSTTEETAYGSAVGENSWDITYEPPLFSEGGPGGDLATEEWVEGQGYVDEEWVTGKNYATESYVHESIAEAELDGTDVDLSAYATQAYVDEETAALSEQLTTDFEHADSELQSQINVHTTKIDALEGKVGSGQWTFTTAVSAPRLGEFILIRGASETTTRWDQAAAVNFNPQDTTGQTYDFSKVVDGDVIRLLHPDIPDINFAEYKVSVAGTGLFNVTSLVRAGGNAEEVVYNMEHLSSFDPAGLATIDYVDQKDDLKADKSELNQYLTTSDANKNYLKDGSTTNKLMINRTAGGSIDSMKVSAISGGATIWKLDCKAGKDGPVIYQTDNGCHHQFNGKVYLERVGNSKDGLTIEGRKTDGTIGRLLYVYHNTGSVADAINYNGKIDSDHNIATKKYVDDAVGTGTSNSDEHVRPAQLSWVYDGDKGNETHSPTSGKFTKTLSSGNIYLRFSFNTNNGCSLGDGKFTDTSQDMDYGPIGTIWTLMSNGKWKLKRQFRINSWRWNYKPSGDSSAHFEFRLSHSNGHDWSDLTVGSEYFITVGGFF